MSTSTTAPPQSKDRLPPGSDLPPVATRQQVSDYTSISIPTLARWAGEGKGPKFRRAGGRVLYVKADVLAWLDSLAEAS